MDYIRKFCFMLTLLYGVSVYSAEFDDLESRIDRMLERLSKVELETPDSQSVNNTNPPLPSQTDEELPQIILPASSQAEVTLQNNETTDSFDHLESRVDQMLERLNQIDSQTSPPPPPQDVETPVSVESEDKLPQIILPPLPQSGLTPGNSEVAESFNNLEKRINNLLNRLDLPVSTSGGDAQQTPDFSPPTGLPVIDLDKTYHNTFSSFALPEDTDLQNQEPPPLPKNRFSFYLGFSIPNDSTYSNSSGNHDIEFKNGYEIGIEYNRFFVDNSYIGGFIEGKFFDTGSLAGNSTNGDNRLINFGFTLGQDWTLSEHFAVKTQASIGASSAHYEITFDNYSSTDLAFHYSFLLGLEVKWNEYWHTHLYYELDGRSSADRMDYQSFHQIGVETGIGF